MAKEWEQKKGNGKRREDAWLKNVKGKESD